MGHLWNQLSSILRPEDPSLSREEQSQLQASRLLTLLVATLILLFAPLYATSNPDAIDPLWGRIGMAGLLGILVPASYVSTHVRSHYATWMRGLFIVTMAWVVSVAMLNRFSGEYAAGLLVAYAVLTAVVGMTAESGRPMAWFSGVGLAIAAAGIGFSSVSGPGPKTDPLLLLASLAAIGLGEGLAIQRLLSTQKALQTQKEQLSRITGNVSEGIYRSTPEEGLVYANQAFAEMFGYESVAAILQADSAAFYADPAARERLLKRENQHGGIEGEEVRFRRRDGTTFIGLLSSTVVRDEQGDIQYYDGAVTDITERKRREQRLRVLSEVVEQAHDGILVTAPRRGEDPTLGDLAFARGDPGSDSSPESDSPDEAGTIVYANRAFEKMTGYREDELLGQTADIFRGPETDPAVIRSLQKAQRNGESWEGETVNYRKDGTPYVSHWNASPVQDEEGTVEYWASIQRDVTDRRKMEERLREQETQLRGLVNSLPGVAYQFYARPNGERGCYFVSEHATTMLGLSSDPDSFYEEFDEHIPASHQEKVQKQIDQAIETEQPWRYEIPFETSSGDEMWLYNTATPERRNGELVFNGVMLDITERKEMEQTLTYRSRLESKIVDISTRFINTPLKDLDREIEDALAAVGRFVDADRSYVFLFDDETKTMSSTHEWRAESVAPSRPVLQNTSYEETPWFIERMHNRDDPLDIGSIDELPPNASGLSRRLERGNVRSLLVLPMLKGDELAGFVGFDAVRNQRDWDSDTVMILRVLTEAISNALQRKTTETEMLAAKEEAEEANRMKSVFLANMSHEIRTPLTSIIGFAEAIGDELGPEAPAPVPRFARLIEQSGTRLLETLDGVLNLSKLEAGEMELSTEVVDLAAEAEEVASQFEPQAESSGIDLCVETNGTAVPAQADEGGVQIVLRNLISNAIKYTDDGGTVWVRARIDDDAVIAVEDTGIGMAPEQVPALFEAFRQASEGLAREYEGTGLGLAVTKQAVDRMGGTIEVETEKGEGSCFVVRLPKADPVNDA